MEQLLRLKSIWEEKKIRSEWTVSESDILKFETDRNVKLPEDFRSYFKLINGMDEEVDNDFFEFYSLNKVDDVVNLLGNYGTPRHGESIVRIRNPKNCFVFADYSINLIAYAIRLNDVDSKRNEIYAICGDVYKIIAESFLDFISLYLDDSDELII
jgi:SMI1 / KNR4 family (SUKH-1)